MRFRLRLPIQFRDFDVLGHVNSTTYLQYMETARVRLLHALAPQAQWYRPPIILVSARCEYRRPITAADEVEVAVWTSRIGTSSWDFEYTVAPPREVPCAVGRTTQVAYSYGTDEAVPIDADLRQRLESHGGERLALRG